MADAGQVFRSVAGVDRTRGHRGWRRGRLGGARAGDAGANRAHRRPGEPTGNGHGARAQLLPRDGQQGRREVPAPLRRGGRQDRRPGEDGAAAPGDARRAVRPLDRARPRADARGVRAAAEARTGDADRLLDELQACGESVGGGILRVPESELIAVAWPLSNVPTGITVTAAGGKPAFARCAIDALGVSALTANARSSTRPRATTARPCGWSWTATGSSRPARPGWSSCAEKDATTCRSSPRRRRRRPGRKRTAASRRC